VDRARWANSLAKHFTMISGKKLLLYNGLGAAQMIQML
jgi:hypothetical protein